MRTPSRTWRTDGHQLRTVAGHLEQLGCRSQVVAGWRGVDHAGIGPGRASGGWTVLVTNERPTLLGVKSELD